MKKMIIMILLFLIGNASGYFLKDYTSAYLDKAFVKDSKSCVGLTNEETFTCISEVVESGAASGNDLFVLGQLYLYGFGTDVNDEMAVKTLERSAFEFDNVDAMVLLGNLFFNTDRLAGQYWYSQAAQRGSMEGLLSLANIYRYSEADLNPRLALDLYEVAADLGSEEAQYELALIYAMGFGVDPDIERSVVILEGLCGDDPEDESCALLKRVQALQTPQEKQAEIKAALDDPQKTVDQVE